MAIGAVAVAAAESDTRRCGAAVWSSREAPVGGEEDAEECGEDEGDEDDVDDVEDDDNDDDDDNEDVDRGGDAGD